MLAMLAISLRRRLTRRLLLRVITIRLPIRSASITRSYIIIII